MDFLALLFAVAGGILMGTYPVPIKCRRVLDAEVHPVVFQLYKSTWVCLTGFLFLIPRAVGKSRSTSTPLSEAPLYVYSPWATLSAVSWVPSGLTTIFSVPLVGVGLAIALAAGSSSTLSFLVFWLLFRSKMKPYSCGDNCTFYLAPLYLCLTVVGMFALSYAPSIKNVPAWLGGPGLSSEQTQLKVSSRETDSEKAGGNLEFKDAHNIDEEYSLIHSHEKHVHNFENGKRQIHEIYRKTSFGSKVVGILAEK